MTHNPFVGDVALHSSGALPLVTRWTNENQQRSTRSKKIWLSQAGTGWQLPWCSWRELQVVQHLRRRPHRVPPLPVRAVPEGRQAR